MNDRSRGHVRGARRKVGGTRRQGHFLRLLLLLGGDARRGTGSRAAGLRGPLHRFHRLAESTEPIDWWATLDAECAAAIEAIARPGGLHAAVFHSDSALAAEDGGRLDTIAAIAKALQRGMDARRRGRDRRRRATAPLAGGRPRPHPPLARTATRAVARAPGDGPCAWRCGSFRWIPRSQISRRDLPAVARSASETWASRARSSGKVAPIAGLIVPFAARSRAWASTARTLSCSGGPASRAL